jgi:hypothetical protein
MVGAKMNDAGLRQDDDVSINLTKRVWGLTLRQTPDAVDGIVDMGVYATITVDGSGATITPTMRVSTKANHWSMYVLENVIQGHLGTWCPMHRWLNFSDKSLDPWTILACIRTKYSGVGGGGTICMEVATYDELVEDARMILVRTTHEVMLRRKDTRMTFKKLRESFQPWDLTVNLVNPDAVRGPAPPYDRVLERLAEVVQVRCAWDEAVACSSSRESCST